jgi:glycosyltransferase involved in cell wall biosynthesis
VRVLHVINSLSASGGAEHGFARELTRIGTDVEHLVVSLYRSDGLADELKEAGVPQTTLDLDPSSSGWNWLAGSAKLRRLLDQFQPDVVHSSLFNGNLTAQLASYRSSVPVLSTFTNSGDPRLLQAYQPGQTRRVARVLRTIAGVAARRDHVWFRALTRDGLETNCRALGVDPARVVVIPRGVPIPDLSKLPATRSELGLPTDIPVVLNVGRQTAQKGQEQLIEAFRMLVERMPAHLVIIGREGDAATSLAQAITTARLSDHVSVVPYTDRVYDYYRNSDVFAFTSLMEGLGTAVLEAMSAELPVVSYDLPPVREVTDGGRVAHLVSMGDINAMSEALGEALVAPASATTRAHEARGWVETHYTIDRAAELLHARLVDLASM